MFIDKFVFLCNQKGVKPSNALDDIGMARSNMSKWRKWKEDGENEKLPYDSNLLKIADYFGVPISYFSEEAPEKGKTPAPSKRTEVIMKMYDMLTPENQSYVYDSIAALLKEQQ